MFDVAVVGAGPAGCAAALAATGRGARVLLLDRAAFPRDKPCGDGIAPHALAVLDRLGAGGVVDGYPPVARLRVTGPGGDEVDRALPEVAHTVPRTVFDHRLVRVAVAAGAVLRRHPVHRIEEHPDHVTVDGLAARVLIGADGASSTVRRYLGHRPNPPGHLALALRGYAPMPPEDPSLPENLSAGPPAQRIVMTGQGWPAYAWSFPIGDGRRNVGYGEVLQGAPTTGRYLRDRLAALLPDLAGLDVTALRAHHLPLSTRRPTPGRGRVLLAGDALSLINPFTGEGIYYAVRSGELAGAEAAAGDAGAGERYTRALAAALGRHLRHTRAAAWLGGHRWLVDAGVRAARRREPAFEALVALGLGDGLLTPGLLGSLFAEALRPRLR
ncbi:geranylgeranyl reductase family protein [Natronosporangium hydrolyticum]|uniref:Geranylgeranyl reductase family protein n=1 Tax=Natronosporangium hydrolyticum TaxID=2811111 RepID=A0A895YKM3_9ACTN|nr:geranylgeranyl reductase family protein [Natronosporangium hydrolyticum]QSB16572.1 geranylgeranyl reductase family protein [Natronosporangium hydrolyticum]